MTPNKKRIPQANFAKLEAIAEEIAEAMYTGRRQVEKERYKALTELIAKYPISNRGKDECPKEYTIVYTYTLNLGTHTYPDTCYAVAGTSVGPQDEVKETEKSYIINRQFGRTVVNKSKVLCFVW